MNIGHDNNIAAVLSTVNENSIKFTSQPRTFSRNFIITLNAVNELTDIKTVTLTKYKPTFALDIRTMVPNSAILVELNEDLNSESDLLEIFANFNEGSDVSPSIMFYYNLNFEENVFNIERFFGESKDAKAFIPIKSYIYVYRLAFDYSFNEIGLLFFRAKKAHTKNCVFKDSIYNVFNAGKNNEIISFLSNGNGTCEIVLLNLPVFDSSERNNNNLHAITHFWTTSDKNVTIFRGNANEELFFEFNNATDITLNAMLISSQLYTIILPLNGSIVIQLTSNNIINLTYPYKALWSTPFYGTPTTSTTTIDLTFIGQFNIPKNLYASIKILTYDTSDISNLDIRLFRDKQQP
uniref:Allorecognition 2 n=1 Tax=Panagrolaimus sp. PS1159 TaxID=55785 RepID=A0AC35G1G2_9BILA